MAGYRRVKQGFVSSASLAAVLIFTFTCLFFSPIPAHARPGDRDLSFGDNGTVALGAITPLALLTETEGSLLVVSSRLVNRPNRPPLYSTIVQRYNADGAPDITYNVQLQNNIPNAAVLQPDGRLVLVVYEITPNSPNGALQVIRLNTDGSPDASFGTDGRVTLPFTPLQFSGGRRLVVQADGKIIIGGEANTRLAVVRLNPDGSLDTGYGRDGRFTARLVLGDHGLSNLLLQADGRLVIGAIAFDVLTDKTLLGMMRVTTEGTLDTSFADGGRFVRDVSTITANSRCYLNSALLFAQQADGKLLSGGALICLADGPGSSALLMTLRVNSNGSPDTTYGTDGIVLTQFVNFSRLIINNLALDTAGRPVIAGHINNRAALVRLTTSGALDTDFGMNGIASDGEIPFAFSTHIALAFAPDGRILTGSAYQSGQSTQGLLVRYLIGDPPPASQLPSAFALQFPVEDQRFEGGFFSRLAFLWEQARDAATYTLEVHKISDNVRLGLVYSKTVPGNTLFVNLTREELALFTPGTYAWTVTASNSAGSTEAAGRVFSINASFDEVGLIDNGSFEDRLSDWRTRGAGKGDRVLCNTPERRVSFAGACAYRFTGNPGENTRIFQQYAVISVVEPGDRLILSAALRNISAQAQQPVVALVVTYLDGGRDQLTLNLPAAGGEYVRLSASLVLNGVLDTFRVELRDRNTNGVFFVDDVRLGLEPNLDALRGTAGGVIPLPAASDDATLRGGQ